MGVYLVAVSFRIFGSNWLSSSNLKECGQAIEILGARVASNEE